MPVDVATAVLRKTLPAQAALFGNGTTYSATSGKYSGMSVRWAILNLLAEDAIAPLPTAEVAATLQKGGISSGGKNFGANVSAVLSQMTNGRKETEQAEGGYCISEHGREVWDGIKKTEKYQNRQLSNGFEQPA